MLVRAHLLNAIAYAALHLEAPIDAKRLVSRAALKLRAVDRSEPEARRFARALRPFGTCLSRSLAVAAMLRGAQVVIGVRPGAPAEADRDRQGELEQHARPHLVHAHAWIEYEGTALCVGDDVGAEIARL